MRPGHLHFDVLNDAPVSAYALTDIITPTSILPLLSSPSPALLSLLVPFLPPDVPPTADSLRRVVQSIDFRRAVGSLDRALRTGALGSFVGALGLPAEAALGALRLSVAMCRMI